MESGEQSPGTDEWYDDLSRPSRPPPTILYYYCSVDTFIKIVTNKTLWLTNLFFLNDSQEHFWLRSKSRHFIQEQIKQHPDDFGYKYLDTTLKQEWRHEIYCACFSECPDLLSQWRAYGDDGKGVAIGFSFDHLQRLSTALQGTLSDVIYDDAKQNTLIERAFELFPRLCDSEDPTIEEASGTILRRISEAAGRCKNKAFSEEAEWRLVCEPRLTFGPSEDTIWTNATVPRYMERKGLITPYMVIPLVDDRSYQKRGMEPIKEVYFGPKNQAQEQDYAAAGMLASNGFKRVRFVHSSASYK